MTYDTAMRDGPSTPEPDAGIAWRWDDASQAEWGALLARASLPTLEQSWAYGAAIEAVSRYRARRGVAWRGERPVALLQAFERRIGPLTLAKILRGPVLLERMDEASATALLRPVADRMRIRHLRLLFWMPENPDGGLAPVMRALGKRPVVEGYATSVVDLTPDEADLRAGLDGKWRNQLGQAERAGLRVQTAHGGRYLDLLVQQHEAFRRAKRHHGHSGREVAALVQAIRPKEDALILTAQLGSAPVAGILLVKHGRGATYHVAWTSAEGRTARAHNLLLWRGMLTLKSRGVAFLDLGGIDDRAPGVAAFKLGLGGGISELGAMYL